MTASLVVGAGGLLGSAVVRALRASGEAASSATIDWQSKYVAARLSAQIRAHASAARDSQWQVYWCAGSVVTSSSEETVGAEAAVLRKALEDLAGLPSGVVRRGSVIFSSSAGALYAGSPDAAPFTELSPPHPTSPYGRAKFSGEKLLQELVVATGFRSLSARISNVYGPGQSLRKPQGLISQLCWASITRQPLSVFVPLDTLRDYIYVDDAAQAMVSAAQRLTRSPPGSSLAKIVASGNALSVGAVVGEVRRVSPTRVLIVTGDSAFAALQPRDLRFRSVIWPDLNRLASRPLAEGIGRTLAGLRASFARGLPVAD